MLGGKWTVLASTARRRHLKKGGELAGRAELKAGGRRKFQKQELLVKIPLLCRKVLGALLPI